MAFVNVPKDLGKRLFADQWSKGIPTILTSETLSKSGQYSHIEQSLGMKTPDIRLTETKTFSQLGTKPMIKEERHGK